MIMYTNYSEMKDSSNSSQGDPERRRQKQQQIEMMLVAKQREWDNKRKRKRKGPSCRCEDINDDTSKQSMRCLNEVRTDAPKNKEEEVAKAVNDYGDASMATNRSRRQKKKSKAREEGIGVDGDEGIDGSGGKKRRDSRFFEKPNTSSGSPNSLNVNQGDVDCRVEGHLDSQGDQAKKKDEVIEMLDSSSEEESSEDEALTPEWKQSKVSSYY